MELIEALDLAIFDGWNDSLLKEIDSHCRGHEVYAFEFPALTSQPIDYMTVQDRSGRMADKMQAHFRQIGKVRGLSTCPVEFHPPPLSRVGNCISILFHLPPDRCPRRSDYFYKPF